MTTECDRIIAAYFPEDILQISISTVDDAGLKKSYRAKSILVHPDKCSCPSSVTAFKMLNNAKEYIYNYWHPEQCSSHTQQSDKEQEYATARAQAQAQARAQAQAQQAYDAQSAEDARISSERERMRREHELYQQEMMRQAMMMEKERQAEEARRMEKIRREQERRAEEARRMEEARKKVDKKVVEESWNNRVRQEILCTVCSKKIQVRVDALPLRDFCPHCRNMIAMVICKRCNNAKYVLYDLKTQGRPTPCLSCGHLLTSWRYREIEIADQEVREKVQAAFDQDKENRNRTPRKPNELHLQFDRLQKLKDKKKQQCDRSFVLSPLFSPKKRSHKMIADASTIEGGLLKRRKCPLHDY